MHHEPHRLGAVATLIVASSGFVVLGVGSGPGGLVVGGIVLWGTGQVDRSSASEGGTGDAGDGPTAERPVGHPNR